MGDIVREPNIRVKYGLLFEAVARRFVLIDVYDANLSGLPRLFNALLHFHPNHHRWRERFYKNIPAFRARSRQLAGRLQALSGQVDAVLQVGVLFDASWGNPALPNIIYTDYTAYLSAQKPAAGRSPFTGSQRERWISLERQAFERASHICTRSQRVRSSIINDYGIPAERVSVVGGGVNFDPLPAVARQPDDQPPTVLFIGKELYRKGGDLLLQAFARARRQIPTARLRLVTLDPVPASLPVDGVDIVAPTWDRAVVAELYRQADLFVLPSRLETWGDVLLEAMAYQLPCIGVAGEAMEEIIQHRATGLIVPPDNIEALTDALVCLLQDVPLRRQWGRAARQRLEQEYTWTTVVERLAPIIETAAAQRRKNRKELSRA